MISGKREGYEGRAQQNAMKEEVREFLEKQEFNKTHQEAETPDSAIQR